MCVPQNHMLKSHPPKMMVVGGGAFGRCLDYDGRTLMNGISFLIKEALDRSLMLSVIEVPS